MRNEIPKSISATLRRWSLFRNGKRAFLIWAILAYIILVPSLSLVPHVGPYNEKRALQIGLLIMVGCVLFLSSTYRQEWLALLGTLPTLACWGLGSVLGIGAISSVLAPAPQAAFLELGHFVLLFVTAGVVASVVRRARKREERLLLRTITIGVLLYAVYFIVGYSVSLTLPALQIGRDTIGGFVNIRFFNQYQTWTLPLLGGSFLALPKQWRIGRGLVFLLIALWWTLVLASDVRGTIVAMAIGALGVTLLFRNRSYPWLGLQVAALLAGGVLYYFLFTLGGGVSPEVVERFGEVGQSNRLQNWEKCLEMAWRHPWLGVGPMHFAWPPYDFAVGAHPHNAFLQWLAEWGVPSTIIMSSLTIWGGWSWMQQERRRFEAESKVHRALAVSLVAAVLAGTAHAMVSGVIVMPVSQVFLVLLGGWAWGRCQIVKPPTESNVPFSSHIFLGMLLAGSITIVSTSLWDLTTVDDRRKAFRESVNRSVYSPRYWGQGYIGVRDPEVIEQARLPQE